jgi:predicted ATPase
VAQAVTGDPDGGLQRLRQGLVDWRATGSDTYLTYYLGLLADALLTSGDAEGARTVLTEALEVVERTEERIVEADLYRRLGQLALQTDPGTPESIAGATAAFQRAEAIARSQEARSLQLLIADNLRRMLNP